METLSAFVSLENISRGNRISDIFSIETIPLSFKLGAWPKMRPMISIRYTLLVMPGLVPGVHDVLWKLEGLAVEGRGWPEWSRP